MEVHSVEIQEGLSFDEYQKNKGYSHSWLKREFNGVCPAFQGSKKVEFGSLVDDLLTDPANADLDNPDYFAAVEVATAITNFVGESALASFKAQLSFTGILEWRRLQMPVRGRLDLFGMGIVFDFKITDEPEHKIDDLIEFMGYKNQGFLYSKAMKADKFVLIFYSRKSKKVILKPFMIEEHNKFFEDKLLKFGK